MVQMLGAQNSTYFLFLQFLPIRPLWACLNNIDQGCKSWSAGAWQRQSWCWDLIWRRLKSELRVRNTPPQLDKQFMGGPFRFIQKSNGSPQMPARHQISGFNFIWAHFDWTEYVIWEIELCGKTTPSFLKFPQKDGFTKSQVQEQLSHSKSP